MVIETTHPDLVRHPDPNIVLLKLIKDQFGAIEHGSTFPTQKYGQPNKIHVGGSDDWYTQGSTPYIVCWWTGDDVGRVGLGSSKRYHHSKHKVWVWCRHPDERWEVYKELCRIFQRNSIRPNPDIERLDYYAGVPWQQETGGQLGVLYRLQVDVVIIWVA